MCYRIEMNFFFAIFTIISKKPLLEPKNVHSGIGIYVTRCKNIGRGALFWYIHGH